MKILVDTNVILDTLLYRVPFYDDSRVVHSLVEQGNITGYISSSAMTDIFYLSRKELKDTGSAVSAGCLSTQGGAAARGTNAPQKQQGCQWKQFVGHKKYSFWFYCQLCFFIVCLTYVRRTF
jgi:hypothetical protein